MSTITITLLKVKRAITQALFGITPQDGELVYDTTLKRLRVGDGSTLGGEAIRVDLSQVDGLDQAAALGLAPYSAADTSAIGNVGTAFLRPNGLVTSHVSTSNVDSIWHDDGANTWHMCSDTTLGGTGNTTLRIGALNEGGTLLSNKYLAIGDTASNSDKLGGYNHTDFTRTGGDHTITGAWTFNTNGGLTPLRLIDGDVTTTAMDVSMATDGKCWSTMTTTRDVSQYVVKLISEDTREGGTGVNASNREAVIKSNISGMEMYLDTNRVFHEGYGDCVKTAHLGDECVTDDKLGVNAVRSIHIKDGDVTTSKLASRAVSKDQIADNSITLAKMRDGAVSGDVISDGGIPADKLVPGSINTSQLADHGVNNVKLAQMEAMSIKGNNTAVLGEALNLSVDQMHHMFKMPYTCSWGGGANNANCVLVKSVTLPAGTYAVAGTVYIYGSANGYEYSHWYLAGGTVYSTQNVLRTESIGVVRTGYLRRSTDVSAGATAPSAALRFTDNTTNDPEGISRTIGKITLTQTTTIGFYHATDYSGDDDALSYGEGSFTFTPV